MKYIKPYKAWFILGPLCMIVEVIGEVLMPMMLAGVINAGNLGTLTVGSSIGTAGLMILIALFMMAGGIGGCYFSAKASIAFAGDIRNDLYRKIQSFSFGNIDRFSTGSLVTRVTNDVTQMQNFVAMLMRMALRAPGMMIGGLVMAIRLRSDLAVVFLISIPVLLLFVGGNILTAFPRFKNVQAKVDGLNSTVQENITNVRVVKSFVRETDEIRKFGKANGDLKNAAMRAMRIVIQMQPVTTLLMYATVIAVAWKGHTLVLGVRQLRDPDPLLADHGHVPVHDVLPGHGFREAYPRGAGGGTGPERRQREAEGPDCAGGPGGIPPRLLPVL